MEFQNFYKILDPKICYYDKLAAHKLYEDRLTSKNFDWFAGTNVHTKEHIAGRRMLDRINLTEDMQKKIFGVCPAFDKIPFPFTSAINITPAYANNQPHFDLRTSGINFALSGDFSKNPLIFISDDYLKSHVINFNEDSPIAMDGRIMHFGTNIKSSTPRAILVMLFSVPYSELIEYFRNIKI